MSTLLTLLLLTTLTPHPPTCAPNFAVTQHADGLVRVDTLHEIIDTRLTADGQPCHWWRERPFCIKRRQWFIVASFRRQATVELLYQTRGTGLVRRQRIELWR